MNAKQTAKFNKLVAESGLPVEYVKAVLDMFTVYGKELNPPDKTNEIEQLFESLGNDAVSEGDKKQALRRLQKLGVTRAWKQLRSGKILECTHYAKDALKSGYYQELGESCEVLECSIAVLLSDGSIGRDVYRFALNPKSGKWQLFSTIAKKSGNGLEVVIFNESAYRVFSSSDFSNQLHGICQNWLTLWKGSTMTSATLIKTPKPCNLSASHSGF